MNADALDFDEWYSEVHRQLVSAVVAVFGDLDLARDSADEACVRAYERWATVGQMDSPNGWAVRVALNVAKRKRRRRALERTLLRNVEQRDVDGPVWELWDIVAELPARQRQAVALRHVMQLSEVEIASVMGISRGGVSSTLRAAYRSLELRMSEEGNTANA